MALGDARPTAEVPLQVSRHRESREGTAGLAVEHGTDDPGAITVAEHVHGMRPGAQDLLHHRLVHAHARQGLEQTGEAHRLDVERLELHDTLLPDLAHGSGAGLREWVRRRLRRRIGDEGCDGLPIDDVVGREQGGGKLAFAARHGAVQMHPF